MSSFFHLMIFKIVTVAHIGSLLLFEIDPSMFNLRTMFNQDANEETNYSQRVLSRFHCVYLQLQFYFYFYHVMRRKHVI
jgi:hypothetical protein